MRGVRAGFQEDSVVGKSSLTDLAEELSLELPQAPLRGGITRSRGSGETAQSGDCRNRTKSQSLHFPSMVI